MKAEKADIVVLCGGKGRRLGKITEKLPKPLVKIGDSTILEMKLRDYLCQGFKRFVICVGYKGDLIREAVRDFGLSANCEFSDAGEPAGILNRLYTARHLFGRRAIITYGDTYTDLNLLDLLETHDKNDDKVTIVAAPIHSPFGLVEFDERGKAIYFKEKPVLNYYIGYAVFNRSALDIVPKKMVELPDGEGLIAFYKMLIGDKKLGVFYHKGLQITFNTEDELKLAQEKMLSFYTTKEGS